VTQESSEQAFGADRLALVRFGWSPPLEAAFTALPEPGFAAARVAGAQRELYTLWAGTDVLNGALSGKLRRDAAQGELPVVGDWVAVRQEPGKSATIHELLPRHTTLARQRAGRSQERQVLAANCDTVFIVSSLNLDWNLRRIERALAMVQASGAQPILVLTKLDLCPDPSPQLTAAAEIAPGVAVHTLSTHERSGLDALAPYLVPGQTIALIGTSGVGKSTLVNSLLGEERAQTGAIRAQDDRGRHTTTRRELYALPSGALVIDTPGMREFGLLDEEPSERPTHWRQTRRRSPRR
jgi:ribosome biogenesis GTPase